MGFDFNYLKKFDFNSVLTFATLGLFKQKKLIAETLVLFLIIIGFFLSCILAVLSLIVGVYFFVTPEYSVFTIIPLIFTLLFLVVTILSGIYFSYRIISFALESIGKKFQKFSIKLAIKMCLSGIVAFFVSFFSLYELKWLLFGIIGVVLFFEGLFLLVLYSGNILISAFGILSLIIACVLLVIYYIMVVRNAIRVSFAGILIVEKDLGIKESVKSSWALTSGKAFLIFIIQLIFTGLAYVIEQIAFVPMGVVPTFGEIGSSSFIFTIGLFILFFILFLIIMVLCELIALFGQVALYKQISSKKK